MEGKTDIERVGNAKQFLHSTQLTLVRLRSSRSKLQTSRALKGGFGRGVKTKNFPYRSLRAQKPST